MVITTINQGWKFYLGEMEQADEKGYQDKDWQTVTLPHDWSVTQPFHIENSSGTGYLPGGIGWYRLHKRLPKELEGKQIWLQFDGVYKNSQVWINGYYLGKRPYGYSTFRYDITPFVAFGETDNVISVRVKREELADSRWYPGTGITRSVKLITAEPVYVEPDGCFFWTDSIDADGTSHMSAEIKVTNARNEATKIHAVALLQDEDGVEYTIAETEYELDPMQTETRKVAMESNKITPWSVGTPALYQFVVKLYENGKLLETRTERVGIRTAVFDPNQGFFLNGINMKLKGVCLHHDAGCLGAAVPKSVWKRRLMKLKATGCNAIRTSHNPHSPELYELCDEMGFVVFDEAFDEWEGPKNKWWQGHNVYPPKRYGYYEDFIEWHERDLKAMIERDRNHPCVILYSIGNEIDYPNDPYAHPMFTEMTGNNDANKPKEERVYNPDRPCSDRLSVIAEYLSKIVKETDSTRPVSLASAFPELSSHIGLFDHLDVIGYNYKEQFYEEDHKRFPNQPFVGSENSHEVAAWLSVVDHPYISGQFLWTGIDYLGEASGWPVHGSPAGLLTTAGFEKSNYYYRKSLWSSEPFVWIVTAGNGKMNGMWGAERTYNYKKNDMVDVMVYTNQPEVELFINGVSCGSKMKQRDDFAICWTIPYEAGILKAVAADAKASDYLETTGEIRQYEMKLWEDSSLEFKADGESVAQIEVTALDVNGIPVSWEERNLQVEIEGEGTLLGVDNGNLSDNTPYFEPVRDTYHGKLMIYVRSTNKSGSIRVRITDELKQHCDLYLMSH